MRTFVIELNAPPVFPVVGVPAFWYPVFHVQYQDQEAVFSIPDGRCIKGHIPLGKRHLLLAWMEIHRDELMANWELAARGDEPYKIEPLK